MAKRKHSKSSTLAKQKISMFWMVVILALAAAIVFFIVKSNVTGTARVQGANTGGFDQYGYNNNANIFNGTGSSWCSGKGLNANCMGIYSPDKLVMKWNSEWNRGNAENWSKPPYKAWIDNEWNGKNGGSGAVWHYKIVWNGPCGSDYTPLPNGGYCIWGQFETIMDQGVDPNLGPAHMWFSKATPAGYGANLKQ